MAERSADVPQTVDYWVDEFLIACTLEGKSHKTVLWYRDMLRWFLEWLGPHYNGILVNEIDTSLIRQYLAWLQSRPPKNHKRTPRLSDATVRGHYMALRAFYGFLVWEGTVSEEQNPMRRIRAPRLSQRIVPALHPDQLESLINCLRQQLSPIGYRNYLMVLFLLDTGVRAGELVQLSLGDLDLRDHYGLAKVWGKGARERMVPLGRTLTAKLECWIDEHRPKFPCQGDWLFVTESGGSLTTDRLQKIIYYWARKAGIEARCSPHVLRHTFAVSFLRARPDQFALQKILGHSTLEMTRRYVNLILDDIVEAHRIASPVDGLGL